MNKQKKSLDEVIETLKKFGIKVKKDNSNKKDSSFIGKTKEDK